MVRSVWAFLPVQADRLRMPQPVKRSIGRRATADLWARVQSNSPLPSVCFEACRIERSFGTCFHPLTFSLQDLFRGSSRFDPRAAPSQTSAAVSSHRAWNSKRRNNADPRLLAVSSTNFLSRGPAAAMISLWSSRSPARQSPRELHAGMMGSVSGCLLTTCPRRASSCDLPAA